MVIDELLQVLPPPDHPVELGIAESWGKVTEKFGGPLPTDYMQFIDRFGSGTLNSFLTPFNPFSRNQHINLFEQVFVQLSALRELRAEFPEYNSYPLFFEPGGLLPWGTSIDGDVFCWLTAGASGAWHTVVVPRHGEAERFPMSMTQFLARAISGSVKTAALPSPFPHSGSATYEPLQGAL
jgi:hypothetical protein